MRLWYCKLMVCVLIATVSFSCKKKERKCGYDVIIDAPSEVNEGDDVKIIIRNLAEKPFNTNYTLYPVNKEGLSLSNGSVLFQQRGQEIFEYVIEDFDIHDAGNYYLTVSTGYDHCKSFGINKLINLTPTPSPCKDKYKPNTLFVTNSFAAEDTAWISYSPLLYGESESGFTIQLKDGPFSDFNCELEFFTGIPDYSSSYTGLSGHGTTASDLNYDSKLYCNVRYSESGYAWGYFKLENFVHSVYVERVGEQLIISFCDVKFKGGGSTERYASTVMVLHL